MSRLKSYLRYLILPGIFFFVGCKETAELPESNECIIETTRGEMFFGSPDCIAKLETKEIKGYWFVDFETSLFFPTLRDLESGSIENAYSLEFLDTPPSEVVALRSLAREKIFRVSFMGSESETPGIYGRVAEMRGGVVVKEGFSIEHEIVDVPTIK